MAFQRLNMLARKNTPGLHSLGNADSRRFPRDKAAHYESSTHSDRSVDLNECNLEDFGARLERCKGSPGKDSLSKRKKLLGSLRSLRSLANLHSHSTKAKDLTEPHIDPNDLFSTPLPVSPSLALLHFEQSPIDQPMFELNMRRRSTSSTEVHHSSPLTVPTPARLPDSRTMVTSIPDLTIPDTPGPLQRAYDRDPTNYLPCRDNSPTQLERYTPSTPVLTPLPGTNLPMDDIDPEFVLLPPSINTSTVDLGSEDLSYYDVPIVEPQRMHGVETLADPKSLKLAHGHGGHVNRVNNGGYGPCTQSLTRCYGTYADIGVCCENSKLQRPADRPKTSRTHGRELLRKPQIDNSVNSTHTLNTHQHPQAPLLCPQKASEPLQIHTRKKPVFNKDWETFSDRSSMTSVSEMAQVYTSQPGASSPPDFNTRRKSQQQIEPGVSGKGPTQEKTWGGTAGLYDGSGYGDSSTGPTTPCEPDEGIQDVRMLFKSYPVKPPPATWLVPDNRCIKEDSPRPTSCEKSDMRHEQAAVRKSRDYESLESMYSAYALFPDDSNHKAGEDIQLTADANS